TDGGDPQLSNHATINVTVTDANDNAPIFILDTYSAMVNEAATIGEKIVQVLATDFDDDKNGNILYEFAHGSWNKAFRLDSSSGWITLAGPLDRETQATYQLQVVALDNGIPQLSTTAMIDIDIADANDNPPMITDANKKAYVK
ncbi:unnamed protein product, partial [Meganyctiphanes norvegica]